MKIKYFLAAALASVMMCTSVFGANLYVYIEGDPGVAGGYIRAYEKYGKDFEVIDDIILLFVNGNVVSDAEAVIENGTTLVPLRVISDEFGAETSWDGDTKTVSITYGSTSVSVTIGNSYITSNGSIIETTAPAQIIDSLTYVPLRAIASTFGAEVNYSTAFSYGIHEIKSIWIYNRTETPTVTAEEAVTKGADIYVDYIKGTADSAGMVHKWNGKLVDADTITAENVSSLMFGDLPGDTEFNASLAADFGEYYYVRFFGDSMPYGVLIDKYDGSFYAVHFGGAVVFAIR
ncbi:MAG: copper amine oxidase N-terminal domain-containing protein, partial [Eubacterium sp.]|nr:copper amine oxidase N-terminal domain-containing protein [Eubacterium sp.]